MDDAFTRVPGQLIVGHVFRGWDAEADQLNDKDLDAD